MTRDESAGFLQIMLISVCESGGAYMQRVHMNIAARPSGEEHDHIPSNKTTVHYSSPIYTLSIASRGRLAPPSPDRGK